MSELAPTPLHQPTSANTPTNLERVFGFSNEPFNAYMSLDNMSKRSNPMQLRGLSEAMQSSDHPIVQYAAGWAVAEAGLFRSASRYGQSYPEVERQENVGKADALWAQAAEGLDAVQRAAVDEHRAADYYGFALRARQARAMRPLMNLAAKILAEEMPSTEATSEALGQSRSALTELATDLIAAPGRNKEYTITRHGFASELIAGLLFHDQDPLEYVILPASVRQDHHVRSNMRADLMALRVASPHPRTAIQISRDEALSGSRLVIGARQSLCLYPPVPSMVTLSAVATNNRGELHDSRVKARIATMARDVQASLRTFDTAR